MRTNAVVRVAATVAAVGLLWGCASQGDRDSSADSGGGAGPDAGAGTAEVAPAPAGEGASGAGGGAPLALATDPRALAAARDVVRTGEVRLTVDDVGDAAADVRALASDHGGFVADDQTRAADRETDITLRIPADRFEDVRAAVADLGHVESETVKAEDVTAQVVDVDSRVASLQASVERVRGLLAQSGNVSDLALVEGELASREAELESLLGQQRVLADQVALGTLTVHLGEEARSTPAEGAPGFRDGLHGGWVVLVGTGRVATAAAGFALPFLVPAALALVAVRWWRRRRTPPEAAAVPPR
jgi:hypothetical protein